jgi:hypothetical protein
MNIYEMEELSEEFLKCEGSDTFPDHLPKDTDVCLDWLYKAQIANDRFTRHCRNNFMKALEALKLAAAAGFDWEVRAQIKELVKELEKIK